MTKTLRRYGWIGTVLVVLIGSWLVWTGRMSVGVFQIVAVLILLATFAPWVTSGLWRGLTEKRLLNALGILLGLALGVLTWSVWAFMYWLAP